MPDNPNEPRPFDAVLGGQSPPPVNAAVLGGLAGVKRRLASTSNEVRIAALSDALKYGQAGLDLVVKTVKTETGAVQWAALNLLGNKTGKTAKQLLEHLPTFTFDVITVNDSGKEISRIPSSAHFFTEDLGNGIFMEMVSIPGGTFLMGSPETEKGRFDLEGPLHKVTVQPFFMGKYVVTQAQWKAVAALPQINRSLDLDPSYLKGANRPVEDVSWHDAMEFCARLAKKTGKTYRLPSEAQWEYACRARTTTPFHFGETITADLANYKTHKTYASEPNGTFRHYTTEVGSFPPNAFGLYDMHGNVWEWCADSWHKNYLGAPSDGSVWESSEYTNRFSKIQRGGSWISNPEYCRSAIRLSCGGPCSYDLEGFRVVCAAAWTIRNYKRKRSIRH